MTFLKSVPLTPDAVADEYAATISGSSLPKYRIPATSSDRRAQTAEIEMRCVHMLADLWHATKSWKTTGCSTTGSSEACMLGGLALKWQWKKRSEAQGKSTDKPNFVCGPVQVCWEKFARYFDVEMRQVPLSSCRRSCRPRTAKACRRIFSSCKGSSLRSFRVPAKTPAS